MPLIKFFDKFIESFSATELKHRVKAVCVFGFLLCIAISAGAVLFLKSERTIASPGTAVWLEGPGSLIEAQLDGETINRIRDTENLTMEFELSGGGVHASPVNLRQFDPETKTVVLDVNNPVPMKQTGRFNIRMIFYKGPYWKLLWER